MLYTHKLPMTGKAVTNWRTESLPMQNNILSNTRHFGILVKMRENKIKLNALNYG